MKSVSNPLLAPAMSPKDISILDIHLGKIVTYEDR